MHPWVWVQVLGLELDPVPCNACITGCEKGGQWAGALALLLSMQERPCSEPISHGSSPNH